MDILYMVGSGRSGTTLLSRLLDLEDDHRAVGEVRSVAAVGGWDKPCGCGVPHRDCEVWGPVTARWAEPGVKTTWDATMQPRVRAAANPLRGTWDTPELQLGLQEVQWVYETLAESGQVLVDESKRPWLGYLLAKQPWATVRFVELVRHPDDVVRSMSAPKEYQKGRPAELASKVWLRKHGGGELARRRLSQPWSIVPYERLANEPCDVLTELLHRPPTGLRMVDGKAVFTATENHIYLSNADKLRRGPDEVRPTKPRSATPPHRGPWQRAAVAYYHYLLRLPAARHGGQ